MIGCFSTRVVGGTSVGSRGAWVTKCTFIVRRASDVPHLRAREGRPYAPDRAPALHKIKNRYHTFLRRRWRLASKVVRRASSETSTPDRGRVLDGRDRSARLTRGSERVARASLPIAHRTRSCTPTPSRRPRGDPAHDSSLPRSRARVVRDGRTRARAPRLRRVGGRLGRRVLLRPIRPRLGRPRRGAHDDRRAHASRRVRPSAAPGRGRAAPRGGARARARVRQRRRRRDRVRHHPRRRHLPPGVLHPCVCARGPSPPARGHGLPGTHGHVLRPDQRGHRRAPPVGRLRREGQGARTREKKRTPAEPSQTKRTPAEPSQKKRSRGPLARRESSFNLFGD